MSRKPIPSPAALVGLTALLLAACTPLAGMPGLPSSSTDQPSSPVEATPSEAGAPRTLGRMTIVGSPDLADDSPPLAVLPPSSAPAPTGSLATDARNWLNYRRQQAGIPPLVSNALIDMVAKGHAFYMSENEAFTHDQLPGKVAFTGATERDRLTGSGYLLVSSHLYGEAIAAIASGKGADATEGLLASVYQRFILLVPNFKEMGAGDATSKSGTSYLTLDLTANNGIGYGLARGGHACYPFSGQQDVPISGRSEVPPFPVPGRTVHGYPISVHANVTSTVTVQSFNLQPRDGSPLPVRLLTRDRDSDTTSNVAAIVPLEPLAPGTTYEAHVVGTIDGTTLDHAWSFTTSTR